MGATGIYTNCRNTRDAIKQHLITEFDQNLGGEDLKLLDYSIRGNLLWVLYRVNSKNYNAIAVVDCKTVDGEFIFKVNEDNMGPYQLDCPQRLLKNATSTHERAKNWYQKCREYHEEKAKLKKIINSIQKSEKSVQFELTFNSDQKVMFIQLYNDTHFLGRSLDDGQLYRYKVSYAPLEQWEKLASLL